MEAERHAQSLARHDPLTGLPNRRVFAEALRAALAEADRAPSAVLLIDLDRFKPINDLHGHAAGDVVLCEVAERLKAVTTGVGGVVARLGGDEFALVFQLSSGADTAIDVSQAALAAIARPIAIDGTDVHVGATIGIALCPVDGRDAETLLHAADLAMYRAKREEGAPFQFFEQRMDAEARARAGLEADLRRALEAGEIVPYYQPLVSMSDRRVVGHEILARWHHPQRGLLMPGEFIHLAEGSGLMADLTYALLSQACLDSARWPKHLMLSLNVSPRHLADVSLPLRLATILMQTGFEPGRLEVEVTESALVRDIETVQGVLASLRSLGVRIALDDFGTGFSSLQHLRELRPDRLKMDRSFVQRMASDAESARLVRAIIALGHSLDLTITAEGIEDEQTREMLAALGCECGQGYLFGRPAPAREACLPENASPAGF